MSGPDPLTTEWVPIWNPTSEGPVGPAGPPGAGVPAGISTQVQFNDGGLFAGDAGLTYDKTGDVLSVTGALRIGTNPAQSGALRLANNTAINARNAANSVDRLLIRLSSDDNVNVGDPSTGIYYQGNPIVFSTAGYILPSVGGVNYMLNAGYFGMNSADGVADLGGPTTRWAKGFFSDIVTAAGLGSTPLNASNLTLGTLPDARLSANVLKHTGGYPGGITTFLRADGTFAAPPAGGGGTPGGSDTQVQFNDGGAFGGDTDLTFNKTTGRLDATGLKALSGGLAVEGNSTLTGTLLVGGNVNVGANLGVTGAMDVTGGSGTDFTTAPIEIATTATPRIAFHWPGVAASQIGIDSLGTVRTYDLPGTGYENFAAKGISATTYVYAVSYLQTLGAIYELGRTTAPLGFSYDWTPVWHVDMVLGSGATNVGKVTRVGNMVFFTVFVVAGPGALIQIAGAPFLTMPVPFNATSGTQGMCEGTIYSAANGAAYKVASRVYDGTRIYLTDYASAMITRDVPFTGWFVNGTQIFLKGWYQENGY